MTAETKPASTNADGNYRIKFFDTTAPATNTDWDGGDDITYSLTPDGWNPSQDQASVADDRLTAPQAFERPGKKTKSLSVKYVKSTTGATTILTEGAAGFIGLRPSVANDTAGAADQEVWLWPVTCGEQMLDAPVANGVETFTQKLFVTGDVTVVTLTAAT